MQPPVPPARVATLQRLEKPFLERVHTDVAALAVRRTPREPLPGWQDWRCILHCHSSLSHDSRGVPAEIAAAALQVGVDAIFLANHPRATQDVVTDGPKGVIGGVLFVPGSEANGFLLYPGDSKLPSLQVGEQALVTAIADTQGLSFIAHPEEHKDWSLTGLTGMEVYNTHADFKDEAALLGALQPKDSTGYTRLLTLLNTMKAYPREAFAAIYDPQPANLTHYDSLSKGRAFAAVAGNDSHENVGFVVKGTTEGKYQLEDALGEKLSLLDPQKTPALRFLFGEPTPGKELFRRQLDPYVSSLGYVSTHVLAPERTERALRQSLAEGRTYVAFDWLADPKGTRFTVQSGSTVHTVGDSVTLAPGQSITLQTPVVAALRLLHDGKEVAHASSDTLSFAVTEPGSYRAEASLTVGGEPHTWILTSVIRVVP